MASSEPTLEELLSLKYLAEVCEAMERRWPKRAASIRRRRRTALPWLDAEIEARTGTRIGESSEVAPAEQQPQATRRTDRRPSRFDAWRQLKPGDGDTAL